MGNATTRYLQIDGVMMPFKDWCSKYMFPYGYLVEQAWKKGFPLSKIFCDHAEKYGIHIDRTKVEDKTKIDYQEYVGGLEKLQVERREEKNRLRHAFYDVEYFFPVGASAGRWVVEKNVDYERLNRIHEIGRNVKYKEARRVK